MNNRIPWLTKLTVVELQKSIKPADLCFPIINGNNELPIYQDANPEPFKPDGIKLGCDEMFKTHKDNIEVSNIGRIRFDGVILPQKMDKPGWLYIELPETNKQIYVYRLVAETWCYNPNSKIYTQVHHISNNGFDNFPENLLWVTSWQHKQVHPFMKSYPDYIVEDELQELIANVNKYLDSSEKTGNCYSDEIDKSTEMAVYRRFNSSVSHL